MQYNINKSVIQSKVIYVVHYKKSMIESRMKFNHELGQDALKHGFKKNDGSPDIEAYKKHLDDICEKIDSIIRKY